MATLSTDSSFTGTAMSNRSIATNNPLFDDNATHGNGTNMTTSPPVPQVSLEDFPVYIASVWLWKIGSPIIITVGTVGNVLSILVFSITSMRRSSVSVYLIILALTDLVVLHTGLLRQWIIVIADEDVRLLSEASCKIHMFLVYFSLQYSAWILVIVTVERCVSIRNPSGLKLCCTVNSRIIIAAILFVLLGVLNSHFFYGMGSVRGKGDTIVKCTRLTPDYHLFNIDVWPWIDMCMFCLIPFTILILSNIMIVSSIVKIKSSVQRFKSNDSIKNPKAQKGQQNISSVTIMLLVLNFVFFVSTLPVSIYLIRQSFHVIKSWEEYADHLLVWACANILQYSNNALNFFLYCFSGRRFRQEMLVMLGFKKKQLDSNFDTSQIRGKSTRYTFRGANDMTKVTEVDTRVTEHI